MPLTPCMLIFTTFNYTELEMSFIVCYWEAIGRERGKDPGMESLSKCSCRDRLRLWEEREMPWRTWTGKVTGRLLFVWVTDGWGERNTQVAARHKAADSPDSLFAGRLFQKGSHSSLSRPPASPPQIKKRCLHLVFSSAFVCVCVSMNECLCIYVYTHSFNINI